jgi:hypothetical protein
MINGGAYPTPLKSALYGFRVSPKKIILDKILLATLINHPTLIEDALESLMVLGESSGDYDELRQAILSIAAEAPVYQQKS